MKNKFLIFIVFIPIFFFASCETTEHGSYEELGDKYFFKAYNTIDYIEDALTKEEREKKSKNTLKYFSTAIENYEKSLAQNPKDINLIEKTACAYYLQANIKSLLKIQDSTDYDKALSYYDKIIEVSTTPETYIKKADIYLRLDKKMNAIAEFSKVLELSPSAEYYETAASIYEDIGEKDSAISAYEKAFELEPTSGKFLYKIALCYEAEGEFDLAENMLHRALSINPNAKYIEEEINEIDKTKKMLTKYGFKSVSEMERHTVSSSAFYTHITTAMSGYSRLVLSRGDIVSVSASHFVVKDISFSNGKYVYLLGASGNIPVATAFYLYTDRRLDIFSISYENFVDEAFVMKCIGTTSYMKNFREVSCYVFELIE